MKKVLSIIKKNYIFCFLVIGLVTFFFSSGRYNNPFFAWVWPLCFLVFLRNMSKKWFMGFLIVGIFIIGTVKWYPFFDNPDFLIFLIGGILASEALIPLLGDYFLYKRIKGFKATLIFPLVYTTMDLIFSLMLTSNIGSIATTQSSFIVLVQSASLFGSIFITFILTWFPTVVLYVFELYKSKKKDKLIKPIATYSSIFMFIMLFGVIRINTINNQETYKVAMVADYYEDNETLCLQNTIKYIETAAKANADILVTNEEYVYLKKDKEQDLINNFRNVAKSNNIYLLVGVEVKNPNDELSENKSYLIDNNANIVFTYIKNKLVPFDEIGKYKVGDNTLPNKTVTLPSGKEIKLASLICFDGNFSSFVRNKVDNDVGTILAPTWDWLGIRDYHNDCVVYRSIENGCSYVRSTYDGISAVIDPLGRVTTRYNSFANNLGNVIYGEATYKPVFTLYKYTGIVTDWIFPASLITIIAGTFIYRAKVNKNNKSSKDNK